jgi:hypothetical protein
MGKIFLTFQLVDRQFCGGEGRKKNVINGYVRRQSQLDSAIIAQGNGHLRLAGCLVSIAYTRGDTRGMAGLITRSGRRRHYISSI